LVEKFEMTIQVLERKNLAVQICEKLQEYILENNLSPGDKLPSEKELMEGFGVGRSSIREALKSLEILGIVESKAGEGTFIKKFSAEPLLMQMIFNLSLNAGRIEDLAEIRLLIEQGAVELVIERANKEDIQRLEELVVQMEAELSKEPKGDVTGLDLQFHTELIKATKNPILAQLVHLWVAFFHKVKLLKDNDMLPLSLCFPYVETHRPLLEAVKRKDNEQSRKWVREHLRFWLDGEFKSRVQSRSAAGA
jgi:GntR family transcriptional repressor for pyruvate dehydrogenase complex